MKKLSEIVQYDLERNTFYKINKETGEQSPTYKNGQKLKTFRPDITGHNYLLRRKSQFNNNLERKRGLNNDKSIKNEEVLPQYSYFKTLDTSRRNSKLTESSSYQMDSPKTRNSRDLKTITSQERHSLKMNIEVVPGELSKQKSNQKLQKQLLNKTLSHFTHLVKARTTENHSPKKDSIPGSQKVKDPTETFCTTINSFREMIQPWDHTERGQPKSELKAILGEQFGLKRGNIKERNLFFEFHPEFKVRISPKNIEVQTQRKKNLKILEELFIRNNNNATRKIYQSIH